MEEKLSIYGCTTEKKNRLWIECSRFMNLMAKLFLRFGLPFFKATTAYNFYLTETFAVCTGKDGYLISFSFILIGL